MSLPPLPSLQGVLLFLFVLVLLGAASGRPTTMRLVCRIAAAASLTVAFAYTGSELIGVLR